MLRRSGHNGRGRISDFVKYINSTTTARAAASHRFGVRVTVP